MNHCELATLRDYQQGLLSDAQAIAIEAHLVECETCMTALLSLVDERDVADAAELLPPDFAIKVMTAVRQERPGWRRKPQCFRASRNSLTYYAAAAAVTLILMGNGFFQTLVEKLPTVTTVTLQAEQQHAEQVDLAWSGKVAAKAARFIQDFEAGERGNSQDD